MSEESRKRMDDLAKLISKERFPMSYQENERKIAHFISRHSYEAGMNDPDAGKEAAKKILLESREKIIQRGKYKPADFQLIDALVSEVEAVSKVEACKELLEETLGALDLSGNACGIAATFLEFHGRPSQELKNCIKIMKRHEQMALEVFYKLRAPREKASL